MNKKIVNLETGEETIIELSAEEIAQLEKRDVDYRAAVASAAATKAALLDKLGITEAEAKLLLGGN